MAPFSSSSAPSVAAPWADAAGPAGGAVDTDALRALAQPLTAGVWDELRETASALRRPWAEFARHEALPAGDGAAAAELSRRQAQVRERIRLDGVTHNVFTADSAGTAAAQDLARPWSLELLPLLIAPADWAVIEAGVVQRARLLEAVLADLHGPQRMLHEGLLPPALLLRHPGWLRPLAGLRPPGGVHLYVTAFDIARDAEGDWWLVAQRTQAPSGLGYVLHNRIVVARQFPDAFRELRVQRLAETYRRLLDALQAQAAPLAGNAVPNIVLLTPGPYSETYFEHAYLARYLGLPLVEGGDLTVRRDRLYLKTVEGLEPVHGVLRRLDDDWCDPLELRPDSALGVPGLVQAARSGHVVLSNALGTGFLETPALQGFLPAIAERLGLGRLTLPALATWWCGEAAAWRDARGALHDKVLRSTYPLGGRTSRMHTAADGPVDDDPDAWTVQSRMRFSRAPVWSGDAVVPRPALLRVYAIADGQGGWHVLPGGMTRVAQREHASLSMQRGGTSLDTWVLSDHAVDRFSMLPQRLQVDDILGRHRPVGSRTGENLFWLGRYTERAEQLTRLARATLTRLSGDAGRPAVAQTLSLLAVRAGLVAPGVPTIAQSPALFERSLLAALLDRSGEHGSFSIAFTLGALERSAQMLRDRLSPEQWRLVRGLGERFERTLARGAGELPALAQAVPALDRLGQQLAAVTGTQTDRMIRDHGWRLLTVGRLLERLQGLATPVEVAVRSGALATGGGGVELLLDIFDSLNTYRARYQRYDDLLALVDMLVLDDTNPRAFAGVLRRLRTEVGKLPGDAASLQPLLQPLRVLDQRGSAALELLRGADDDALRALLLSLATTLGPAAAALADRVGERYFTLAHQHDQRL